MNFDYGNVSYEFFDVLCILFNIFITRIEVAAASEWPHEKFPI